MAQTVYKDITEYLVKYGLQALGGMIILVLGFIAAGWVGRIFSDFGIKKKWDITLTHFLSGVIRLVIVIFAGLMALEKFGVTITPIIATVSAMIFGASFAIQAPLANYAAGLSIILSRPFAVGNTISVHGVSGIVHDIKLPCTVLITEDGETITVPNKEVVGQIIWNSAEYKVVEKTIGISYDSSPERAISVILGVLSKNPKVTQKPAPIVGIEGFGDSSINLGVRYWVPTKEYYNQLYSVNLAIFNAFKEAKITIPFPQREVRFLNQIN